jgi:RHS repeat-associated protein
LKNGASLKEIYYIHTDYLGSWLAITDHTGSLTNKYSYDAWGRPRNPANWELLPINITDALVNLNAMQPRFDRGYTGHELMAGFGLINMNGRLYDPYLQRFLSPDIHVQDPLNSQSYNMYSYCLNNPFMYTDPSGYSWLSDFGNWIKDTWRSIGKWLDDNNITFQIGFNAIPANRGFDYNLNGNVGYTNGNYSFAIGGGIGSNYTAWSVSATHNGYGLGFYKTYYGSAPSGPFLEPHRQTVGGIGIYLDDVSIRVENDFQIFKILGGDGRDRWRSGAWSIAYRDFEVGAFVYTDERYDVNDEVDKSHSTIFDEVDYEGTNKLGRTNKHGQGAWKEGQVYRSPAWIGMRSGRNVARIGISNPWVQDRVQNSIHRNGFFRLPFGYQHFWNRYDYFDDSLYAYGGFYNPYSLYQ